MSRKAVEAAEKKWLEAFNKGDASGVASLYTLDANILAPNFEMVSGRDAIEAFVKEFVQMGAHMRSFKLVRVHETPELSAAVGLYEMELPGDGGTEVDTGKYIEVWAKQSDGSWQIIEDIFNSSLPAPTP